MQDQDGQNNNIRLLLLLIDKGFCETKISCLLCAILLDVFTIFLDISLMFIGKSHPSYHNIHASETSLKWELVRSGRVPVFCNLDCQHPWLKVQILQENHLGWKCLRHTIAHPLEIPRLKMCIKSLALKLNASAKHSRNCSETSFSTGFQI